MTIQTDFEALMTQAKGPQTPTILPEQLRGTAVAASSGGSYGGWFVGGGGTIDGAVPTISRVYLDSPSAAGNSVSPTDGTVAATDIWEEYYENHATSVTYILRAHAGTVFHAPPYGANFTYQQFGRQLPNGTFVN